MGLAARPVPGRPPKLSARQRRTLVRAIVNGPEAAGYPTGLWTCRRIAQFVRARFGVSYHADHIGRLLRTCGLTPQRPQRSAKERQGRGGEIMASGDGRDPVCPVCSRSISQGNGLAFLRRENLIHGGCLAAAQHRAQASSTMGAAQGKLC
jgi:hypothetical protein